VDATETEIVHAALGLGGHVGSRLGEGGKTKVHEALGGFNVSSCDCGGKVRIENASFLSGNPDQGFETTVLRKITSKETAERIKDGSPNNGGVCIETTPNLERRFTKIKVKPHPRIDTKAKAQGNVPFADAVAFEEVLGFVDPALEEALKAGAGKSFGVGTECVAGIEKGFAAIACTKCFDALFAVEVCRPLRAEVTFALLGSPGVRAEEDKDLALEDPLLFKENRGDDEAFGDQIFLDPHRTWTCPANISVMGPIDQEPGSSFPQPNGSDQGKVREVGSPAKGIVEED
jgi:hypothetical protein